jgi:hypothetical protein
MEPRVVMPNGFMMGVGSSWPKKNFLNEEGLPRRSSGELKLVRY